MNPLALRVVLTVGALLISAAALAHHAGLKSMTQPRKRR